MKLIVKVENQSFEVEVGDIHDRPIIATIDGEPFEVWPEDVQLVRPAVLPTVPVTTSTAPVPQAVPVAAPKSSGAAAPVSAGKAVNAPLPGVIVAVNIKPGETVTHGQELCTIEAMKMKNVIRAGRAGTIAAVHVTLNQHVKHHDVLLEFTD
jgi:glutaconyl-CoA/methylmalonyl-CoA decarboxylase subunit gamma